MAKTKTALITGIHGQDGYYLSQLLVEKDYHVVGLGRRLSGPKWPHASRIDYQVADLIDLAHLIRLLQELRPVEIYNLAAQSQVPLSWKQPIGTFGANGLSVINLLEAIRGTDSSIRFFQASSGQMFGRHRSQVCDEKTPFRPNNPYAASKLFAHMMTVDYREGQGLFASCGILFNHESPLRPPSFVSRKIASAAARIKLGKQDKLKLKNLCSVRDWGYAEDYVEGMWLSLQVDKPSDFIFCTGEAHSVRDFARLAFAVVDLNWTDYVTEEKQFRQIDQEDILVGTPNKAQKVLGWRRRTEFPTLVEKMVRSELKAQLASSKLG